MTNMSRQKLAELLQKLAVSVRDGDSAEGFIRYSLPETSDDPRSVDVEARLRIGNLDGQGRMVVL